MCEVWHCLFFGNIASRDLILPVQNQNWHPFLDAQKSKTLRYLDRWRLEVKEEDIEKFKRGELVEPKKQIVYYIDRATPEKWRKYIKQGIEDWQVAFEAAGFKNAIIAIFKWYRNL